MTKLAVITGGSKRIGRAIAMSLHQAGYDIALHYRSSAGAAQRLADELNAQRPDSCALYMADLAVAEQLRSLAAQLLAAHPSIDLLVNNASGFEPTPLETCTYAEFDAMLSSNLKGPYFLLQGLLPGLRAASGSVVNLLDVHIDRPLPEFNVYCAAKAGLASLTRSLAVELGPEVRVNGIAPGAILWPDADDAYDAAMRERTVASTPLQRLGDPGDIARTVVFLAAEAPFITGQIIPVDGGRGLVS